MLGEGIWGVLYLGATQQCAFLCIAPAGCERTEKYGRSVSYALSRLDEDTPFVFHYVNSEFFVRSSFSALKFGLSTYTDDKNVTQSAVSPSGLFAFEARQEHLEVLKFINCSRSHPGPVLPQHKKTEREVLLSIASKILKPLCREVVLEKGYRRALEKGPVPGLEFGNIGMGTAHTWHGTPDARVRGAKGWDGTTLADAKPQVRGCACGAYTHPVLAAPFLPRLFLKQLPDDLCTKFPAKIRARFSDETVHHFTHLEKKDIMWDGVREQVVEGSNLPVSIVYPPAKRGKLK